MKGGPDEPSNDSQGSIPLGEIPETHERGTMREAVVEERGASTLSQARSLQSRLGNLLLPPLVFSARQTARRDLGPGFTPHKR